MRTMSQNIEKILLVEDDPKDVELTLSDQTDRAVLDAYQSSAATMKCPHSQTVIQLKYDAYPIAHPPA